jgi:DNA replicative helicase MCM subunit Mcm2 (Cdc46/Mcm family)
VGGFAQETRVRTSVRPEYREIIRIIRKYHDTDSAGVSSKQIISETKTNSAQTAFLLDKMQNEGVIYESKPGYWKLLPS